MHCFSKSLIVIRRYHHFTHRAANHCCQSLTELMVGEKEKENFSLRMSHSLAMDVPKGRAAVEDPLFILKVTQQAA